MSQSLLEQSLCYMECGSSSSRAENVLPLSMFLPQWQLILHWREFCKVLSLTWPISSLGLASFGVRVVEMARFWMLQTAGLSSSLASLVPSIPSWSKRKNQSRCHYHHFFSACQLLLWLCFLRCSSDNRQEKAKNEMHSSYTELGLRASSNPDALFSTGPTLSQNHYS